jgi:hypothetical protein
MKLQFQWLGPCWYSVVHFELLLELLKTLELLLELLKTLKLLLELLKTLEMLLELLKILELLHWIEVYLNSDPLKLQR